MILELAAEIDDWNTGIENVVEAEDGSRTWPELFVAQFMGWRPLTASLRTPPGDGPHPVVVYIHGGGWLKGHPHLVSPVNRKLRITEQLLAAGYAVAAISYRLIGEGPFPMQIHDCAAGVRFLRANAGAFRIDPERFAAFGQSAGGHMALLLGVSLPPELQGEVGMTGPSCKVQAVVDWYGVADMMIPYQGQSVEERLHLPENPVGRLLGGPEGGEAMALAASPVSHVDGTAAPVLIQHGTADTIATFEHAEHMRDTLLAHNIPVVFEPLQGAEHGFPNVEASQLMPQMLDFLKKYL
ncbi:alpha/beta hydrolase [Salipiger sp. PrR007]|uniref:alpha/beta hydrolase n=1 Tax=Salipiger sp. PrR007 TaxID=2706884 RepID=UPI0013BE2266|nr:alpha/beta hydrolase [Salipiger sp. PrR007]NDW33107.1 alpha/beta hydrolase [Salipiger sp. PrR007]